MPDERNPDELRKPSLDFADANLDGLDLHARAGHEELAQTVQASLREHLAAASAATSALHLQIASADELAKQMQGALGLRAPSEGFPRLIDTDALREAFSKVVIEPGALTEAFRKAGVDPGMLKNVEMKVNADMWTQVARTRDYFEGFRAAQRAFDDLLPDKDLLAQFTALQTTVRVEDARVRIADPVSTAAEVTPAGTRDDDHVDPSISFREIVDTLVLAGIFQDVADHPEHARVLILFALIIFVVRYGH